MFEDLVSALQKIISYNFIDPKTLLEAITHKSFANENRELRLPDNERLEFLGDAVLHLLISDHLIKNYPELPEGDLSKLRATIVSEPSLFKIAKRIDLGDYILLGRGEEHTGGRGKSSILANALEAIIAAIYLDGGMEKARAFVMSYFVPEIKNAMEQRISHDYKTDLQEHCQGFNLTLPKYRVVKETGPDHQKTFEIEILINSKTYGSGVGRTKKEAEQRAAEEALKRLKGSIGEG